MLHLVSTILHLDAITITILLAVLLLVFGYLTKSTNYWKQLQIPYVPPLKCFAKFLKVLIFQMSIGDFLTDLYREMRSKPYFGIWIFGTPHLIVNDPELIKNVLLKDFDYFHDKTMFNSKSIDPIGSRILFLECMPNWSSSRRTLTVAFTSGKLKAMLPLVNECAAQMKSYMFKELSSCEAKVMEAKELFTKFTVAVISSCAFGLEADSFENDDSKFLECGRDMFDGDWDNGVRFLAYFFLPSIANTFKLKYAKDKIYDFLGQAFTQTIKMREESGKSRGDLVDVLIKVKENDKLNGVQTESNTLIAHAIQFFIASAETTSSTLAFTLYEMAMDHQIQNKLREEIETTLKGSETPTYESLKNMPYLSMCISETLRKYPVLPFLDRRCARDYIIPDGSGCVIPRGTPVYIPMYGLHYDPQYFPDPERYDPERFNAANDQQEQRHPFCYLPFGQGPRSCIGERFGIITTKLALINVLTNFKVDKCAETPIPIVFNPKSFLLMSINGIRLRFSKLEH